MSRIFNALQEAARLSGSNGVPQSAWRELGGGGASGSGAGRDASAAIFQSESLAGDAGGGAIGLPPVVTHPEGAGDSPPFSPGVSANILLDKRAPLIPHAINPIVVERYRMLRTKILQERERGSLRSLVITSPGPQEGKTVTVMNLALSFAALPSFKLLVIDGDMRRGTLGSWWGLEGNRPGLSNLIEGSAQLDQILLKSEDLSMCLIPRGNAQVSDLQPSQFSGYFGSLVDKFDLVLVDSPPVNLITDVQTIAGSCDAILLVARAFATTRKSLEEAVEKLQSFRLIGTVLNEGVLERSRRYHGY